MMPGRFIVLEGIDTGVLSEQAEQLGRWLRTEGQSVVTTREPTDGPLGAQLRAVLNGRVPMHDYARNLLFVADRMDHYLGIDAESGIQNDLDRGRFVLSVRHLLSAYAQYSETVELDWLIKVNYFCPWPDLMVFVDIPVESALTRFIKERGYVEVEVRAKQVELAALRERYLKVVSLVQEQGRSVDVIESDSMSVIHRNCVKLVTQRLGME